MYWNIEKFGFNKVSNPRGLRQLGGSVTQAAAAMQRLALIMRMIQQAAPEILVIAEVATGAGADGTLVGLKGRLGSWGTLLAMRATHHPDWCLVPPLQISNREGMAVFYRSTKLIFSGPYRWPGGWGQSAPGVPGAAYPGPPEVTNLMLGQRPHGDWFPLVYAATD